MINESDIFSEKKEKKFAVNRGSSRLKNQIYQNCFKFCTWVVFNAKKVILALILQNFDLIWCYRAIKILFADNYIFWFFMNFHDFFPVFAVNGGQYNYKFWIKLIFLEFQAEKMILGVWIKNRKKPIFFDIKTSERNLTPFRPPTPPQNFSNFCSKFHQLSFAL